MMAVAHIGFAFAWGCFAAFGALFILTFVSLFILGFFGEILRKRRTDKGSM